ncbi:MAG: hypothetical protein WCJ35_09425 [Planctomycetota bacterium]
MDFQKRLESAIERGQRLGNARAEEEAQRVLTEKELQRLHSQARLKLCEHIEHCLHQLADRFLGFRFETIVDPRGWGAAISREDLRLRRARLRQTCFSRLEMLISPISPSLVLDLTAKATVCNREIFSRAHYQRLAELDQPAFTDMIDLWGLEFAERYAAE